MILDLERLSKETADCVGTVGVIRAFPGAVHTIPGEVEFYVDIRGVKELDKMRLVKAFRKAMDERASTRDLRISVETYVDEAPPAGGTVTYLIKSYAGEELRTECDAAPVEPRRCPADLSCCYDISTGRVTLSWLNGVNVEGRSWRIRRNGVPRTSVALDQNTYSDRITGPGVYEYTLELNGGNAAQCPGLPLSCSVVATGEGIAFYDDFECYADDGDLAAAGWERIFTGGAPDDGSHFSITNPGDRGNPPMENGQPSAGKFLISDNDFGDADLAPGSGGSFDLVSPSFSCADMAEVWLHLDCLLYTSDAADE